jgi:hypothetical protein
VRGVINMRHVRFVVVVSLLVIAALGWWLVPGEEAVEAAPQTAPAPSRSGSDPALEDFVPSEELAADSAISFPVDI